MGARPELAIDLYSDAAILAPHPLYRAIRDLAPTVWLPAHGVWALGRFADVRAALRADEALVSRVRRIEVGEPVPLLNNVLRGYRSFPASFR